MSRLPPPAAVVDLSAPSQADQRIATALADAQRDRLLRELASHIAATSPETQALAKAMLGTLAALSAEVAMLRNRLEDAQRSQAQRATIDPLPLIPEDRHPPTMPAPTHAAVYATSSTFDGMGWHPAESSGPRSWRWSGLLPRASLLLPTLGGGPLRLQVDLLMPFSHPFPAGPVTFMANDIPVPMSPAGEEHGIRTYEAEFELPADGGFGSFLLVLPELRYTDPTPSGRRDSRALGLGLRRVLLDRQAQTPRGAQP